MAISALARWIDHTSGRAAVQERSDAERHMVAAIRQARAAGISWAVIGNLVGTTGEAARQRYGGLLA